MNAPVPKMQMLSVGIYSYIASASAKCMMMSKHSW